MELASKSAQTQTGFGARQKIAVIGAGISGNVAARILSARHEVHLFEATEQLGGHTHTVQFERFGNHYAVDTGFMVFNDRTYPNFLRLLDFLDVPFRASDMSFSVRCERSGLEYSGSSLNGLFAQRKNLLRPSYFRMLADIQRFNRAALALARRGDSQQTLASFLHQGRYGENFIERYLRPMIAAIWSACPRGADDIPAVFLARFFANHGLLQLRDRPQWRTIEGGAHRYVEKLLGPLRNRVYPGTPIDSLQRTVDRVVVKPRGEEAQEFDQVVVATHPDQALRMLQDATPMERDVLGSFSYQENVAVLHTDDALLPKLRRAWASWNYHVPHASKIGDSQSGRATLTYNLNRLQGHTSPEPICVTLNPWQSIDPHRIIREISFRHPIFAQRSIAAQQRHSEVNGVCRTFFCGAYWRNGFHEDGVWSALAVTKEFGLGIEDCIVASTTDTYATSGANR